MSWATQFVTAMIEERDGGADFDLAFALASRRWPPEPRELGVSARVRGSFAEVEAVDWWRGVCEDAWHGRREALRFLPELPEVAGDVDESTAAKRRITGGAGNGAGSGRTGGARVPLGAAA